MPKWFNTAGPCKTDIHYLQPPLALLQAIEITQWPPWLVNEIAHQLVEEIAPDPTQVITIKPLLKSTPYQEIAPYLVLMAFWHRVANKNCRGAARWRGSM